MDNRSEDHQIFKDLLTIDKEFRDGGYDEIRQGPLLKIMKDLNGMVEDQQFSNYFSQLPIALLLCMQILAKVTYFSNESMEWAQNLFVLVWPSIERHENLEQLVISAFDLCTNRVGLIQKILEILDQSNSRFDIENSKASSNYFIWNYVPKLIDLLKETEIGSRYLIEGGVIDCLKFTCKSSETNARRIEDERFCCQELKKSLHAILENHTLMKKLLGLIQRTSRKVDKTKLSSLSKTSNTCYFAAVWKCLLNLNPVNQICEKLSRIDKHFPLIVSMFGASSLFLTQNQDHQLNLSTIMRTLMFSPMSKDDSNLIFLPGLVGSSVGFLQSMMEWNDDIHRLFQFELKSKREGTRKMILDVNEIKETFTKVPEILVMRMHGTKVLSANVVLNGTDGNTLFSYDYELKSIIEREQHADVGHATVVLKSEGGLWRHNDDLVSPVKIEEITNAIICIYEKIE